MTGIAKEKREFDTPSRGDLGPRTPSGKGFDGDGLDQDVLRHLLNVEADAQSLVDDAHAEADRRRAEMEKQNRARYEEQYTREAAILDSRYESELDAARADYNGRLEEYRLNLGAREPDYAGFYRLLDGFLGKDS
jgi:hypothetical protein